MSRVIHANCFVPRGIDAELLLTDEETVARAAAAELSLATASPESAMPADQAHQVTIEMWKLAYSWYLAERGDDETVVAGISAGDLAGSEAAIAILLPAAQAALSMAAIIDQGVAPGTLLSVIPSNTPGASRYDRLEALAAEAAVVAARQLAGHAIAVDRVTSGDPRNTILRDKYARTRDPSMLHPRTLAGTAQGTVLRIANGLALVRRRDGGSLLIVEYNPTLAFSHAYAQTPGRRRLARWINSPREILPAVVAGDLLQASPVEPARAAQTDVGRRLSALGDGLVGAGLTVAGVPLWPVVRRRLIELAGRYASFIAANGPLLARRLRRWHVDAVLVPYDTPPDVRLLVRVAQTEGIPTFVLNDGYKADEIQIEGMTADVALATASAMRDQYLSRRSGQTIVTGNPKLASAAARPWRGAASGQLRVLVGTFTYSPIDLNCHRSDAERFLDEVLAGIAGARPDVAPDVLVKLHPADEPAHYLGLGRRHPGLRVELRVGGDVVDLFSEADVYVTNASTSLLEAELSMPAIYYRVNEQTLKAPFEDDDFLGARTASTPAELTRLLRDRDTLSHRASSAWIERYLGPEGASERITNALEAGIEVAQARPRSVSPEQSGVGA